MSHQARCFATQHNLLQFLLGVPFHGLTKSLYNHNILFAHVYVGKALCVFVELDDHISLGDMIEGVITIIRDTVAKALEDRCAQNIGNSDFVQLSFNRSIHPLPVCGRGSSVPVAIQVRRNLVDFS